MNKKSLWERCKISSNTEVDSFVGVKIEQGSICITFPMGYNLQDNGDRMVRKDILSLLSILRKFNKRSSKGENIDARNEAIVDFPILSYQYVILDYFEHGYYSEKEIEYASAKKGKINWKRTIQKKKPLWVEPDLIYLDFVVKKNIVNTSTIITRIHEYCVYESFIKLGWLYTDALPVQPQIKFNKKMFLSVLNEAVLQTFNDKKKQLFFSMMDIINNIHEASTEVKEYTYGTSSFEYVWERMIDYAFGETNKEIYFPKARWFLINTSESIESSSLQPDTIIRIADKIYIIDAKYYKYGMTRNPINLPASASIQKQITYGEYLLSEQFEEIYGRVVQEDNVYNAFVMPFNKGEAEENYKFIGIAVADWKKGDKQYEKVIGLLLDTKYLMNHCYFQNATEIRNLSEKIEKSLLDI